VLIAENNYPLLEVFWTILIFFAWLIWIWAVIAILSDVFRRHDLSGWGKAGWTFLIILIPFLGVLIYLIAHGKDMAERNAAQMKVAQKQYDEHIREVAGGGGGGAATEIANAKSLLDSGAITQAEFDQIKQKALG
jgi:Phospholipase_D-nuclease N-terminal/Short C-terminal domain